MKLRSYVLFASLTLLEAENLIKRALNRNNMQINKSQKEKVV